ncbi:MAG: MFS transporter [Candidatus Azobacteroides sp.]|nr:MFS transporter [Candidatus Azobacteroides sp.]
METTANKEINQTRTMLFPILAGIFFGYNLALIAGEIIENPDKSAGSFFSSYSLLGAILGCATLFFSSNFKNRKYILISAATTSLFVSLIGIIAFSWGNDNNDLLSVLRFFIGITVGLSCIAPVFLIEEYPKKDYKRGNYFSIYQLSITIGILISYLLMTNFFSEEENGFAKNYYLIVFFIYAFLSTIYLLILVRLKAPKYERWISHHENIAKLKYNITSTIEMLEKEEDIRGLEQLQNQEKEEWKKNEEIFLELKRIINKILLFENKSDSERCVEIEDLERIIKLDKQDNRNWLKESGDHVRKLESTIDKIKKARIDEDIQELKGIIKEIEEIIRLNNHHYNDWIERNENFSKLSGKNGIVSRIKTLIIGKERNKNIQELKDLIGELEKIIELNNKAYNAVNTDETIDNIKKITEELIKKLKKTKSQKNRHHKIQELKEAITEPMEIVKKPWLKVFLIPLIIGVTIIFIQQIVGINIIIFELPRILCIFSVSKSGMLTMMLIVGVINTVSTIPGMLMVDRIGRGKLFTIGMVGISISLFFLMIMSLNIKPNYDFFKNQVYVEKNYSYKLASDKPLECKFDANSKSDTFFYKSDTLLNKKEKLFIKMSIENLVKKYPNVIMKFANGDTSAINIRAAIKPLLSDSTYKSSILNQSVVVKFKNGYLDTFNGEAYRFKYQLLFGHSNNAELIVFMFWIIVYVISFACSLGILGWLVPAEIIPIRRREQGMAIVGAVHWFMNLLIVAFFNTELLKIFILIFLVCSIMALIWGFSFFPETMDKSLRDIDYFWRNKGKIKDFNDEEQFKSKSKEAQDKYAKYKERMREINIELKGDIQ